MCLLDQTDVSERMQRAKMPIVPLAASKARASFARPVQATILTHDQKRLDDAQEGMCSPSRVVHYELALPWEAPVAYEVSLVHASLAQERTI